MSLFTVEQIELIRRLRLSGVTAVQIIEAFNTFDRLDQELSSVGNSPSRSMSAILPHMLAPSNHSQFVSTPSSIFSNGGGVPSGHTPGSPMNGNQNHMPKLAYQPMFHHQLSAATNLVSMSSEPPTMVKDDHTGHPPHVDCYQEPKWSISEDHVHSRQSAGDHLNSSTPSLLNNASALLNSNSSAKRNLRASVGSSGSKSRVGHHNMPVIARDQKPVIRSLSEQIDLSDPDLLEQANEMMTHEEVSISEMRDYVTSRQLRQQSVAQMCGISQPYVSKFLNGSFRELSERVRRIIFYWYATAKRNSPNHMRNVEPNTPNGGGESSQNKRERFIFKPVHVRLLEKYFQQDPYPNITKREEIASHLNHAFLAHKGTITLDEKECVSEHVVGTWFSNRRKEKKRKDMKFRQMRVNQSGGQKSLLNTFLSNLRQSALERNEQTQHTQPAITIDDNLEDDTAYSDGDSFEGELPAGPPAENHIRPIEITDELNAVNDSVMALLNPYSEDNQQNRDAADDIDIDVDVVNHSNSEMKTAETATA